MKLKEKTKLVKQAQEQFSGISRSEFKKLFNDDAIEFKNDTLVIKNRDKVIHFLLRTKFKKLKVLDESSLKFEVVYEDKNTLIVNKPRNLSVHSDGNNPISLKEHLQQYVIFKSDNPFCTVQPINRIDKDTTGLVIFSKNFDSHNYYSNLFKKRYIVKSYLAVSCSTPVFDDKKLNSTNFTVESYISRQPKDRKYYSTNETDGDIAITEFKIVKKFNLKDREYFLIKATPRTGRTHQIRVHLSEYGLPIAGDKIYNREESDFKDLMLHSYSLNFFPYNQAKEITVSVEPAWEV